MKRALLCAALACTTMACATSQTPTLTPTPEATPPADASLKLASDPGSQTASGEDGEEVAAAPTRVGSESWLGAAAGSDYVLVGGQEQFVGVWVEIPEAARRAHVPTMLTLTIDTSGSMQGEKIVQARTAARALVQEMKRGDMVAIHTFSDRAERLIAPTVLTPESRQAILSTIAELSADGSTNMFEALELALDDTRRAPASHPVRRVVMISDGRATAGPTQTETLARVAERGMDQGVQVTAMGVGLDYDENTLNELAVRSSGRLFHLSDPQELAGIVKSELGLLQKTMATNAVVEIVPAPGVRLVSAQGVRSQWGGSGNLEVPLGTMFSGQRREILVAFRLDGHEVEGTKPIASARLHFRDPAEGGLDRVQEVVVRGQLTNDASLAQRHENPEVQAIIALHRASTVATAARADLSHGDFDEAEQRLAKAEADLRQRATKARTAEDKKRMMQAASSIAKNRSQVAAAAAAPAPARAAAARKSSLELNDAAMDMQGF
ncbi:MAG: VWA domain-containing protein [Polyangiaceae bacterium]